jgi:hypothetical protein
MRRVVRVKALVPFAAVAVFLLVFGVSGGATGEPVADPAEIGSGNRRGSETRSA